MRIKRKVSISCLGGRLGICLLLAFVPQLLLRRKTVYVSFVTVYRYSRNSMNLYSLLLSFLLKTLPLLPCFIRSTPIPARFFTERVSSSALSDQSFPAISGRLQYKRCIKTVSSRHVIRFRWADQRTGYRTFQQCFPGISACL